MWCILFKFINLKLLYLFIFLLSFLSYYPPVYSLKERTNYNNNINNNNRHFKYTIDELLTNNFPKKITNDLDLDPCKAGKLIRYFN